MIISVFILFYDESSNKKGLVVGLILSLTIDVFIIKSELNSKFSIHKSKYCQNKY